MNIEPMLFTTYKDQELDNYPYIIQPKLDGVRCIAEVNQNGVQLWSRNGKVLKGLDHIKAKLHKYPFGVYDGELYEDFMTFESIVSAVKTGDTDQILDFYAFDYIIDKYPFYRRLETFLGIYYQLGPVVYCTSLESIKTTTEIYLTWGYEGSIIRPAGSLYKPGRSTTSFKLKPLKTEEFKITDVFEGKGRLVGAVGSVQCVTEEGEAFNVKLKQSDLALRELWKERKWIIGELLTVQFQNYTDRGVPRFPVGLAIRSYE